MTRSALPPRTGEDVKIVWRMTGSGDLRLWATDPGGRSHTLLWGPSAHGSSSYDRPGDEWGAGYRFTRAGCWLLRATRGDATADVWIEVASR
jgi:hypothetical protein